MAGRNSAEVISSVVKPKAVEFLCTSLRHRASVRKMQLYLAKARRVAFSINLFKMYACVTFTYSALKGGV